MKYYFRNSADAYSFQRWLENVGVPSDLCNERITRDYSIVVDERYRETADDAYGKFLLAPHK